MMMQTLPGYTITENLHESLISIVCRGYRIFDRQNVILKILKDRYPTAEKIARFQREFHLTKKLDIPGVIKVYELENRLEHWMMILEDFGGQSLARLDLAGKLDVLTVLRMARILADIVGQIHQYNIIHKDINPSNIVYNPATQQIKMIDFGISTELSRETPVFGNPELLEGTLAYISPEQTGRMNRAIDYRSDFYSLGATFYELLTGQVPFASSDVMELVHSHIARQPVPPHELRLSIPPDVSAIVMKLMAKNAEDRYQSAYGLKADIELLLNHWERANDNGSSTRVSTLAPIFRPLPFTFVPGRNDISDRLIIPQKLYGREDETASVMQAFERVCQGTSELFLVSGMAGIGKSALVQEVYKPITRQRGYFISGKFDQLQRDIPYAALVDAFRALLRQILTEGKERIALWCNKLCTTLGTNGQVIVDILPELENIIGPQPELPELGAAESRHRFNLVFQRFIQVFARTDHPLVVFLDDMQWADSASLALLERVLTAPPDANQQVSLLILGAYRDTDIDASHPFSLTMQTLREAGTHIQEIHLEPLDTVSINQLVADTLHRDAADCIPLTDVLLSKTAGNPFFLGEFLKSLYAEEFLSFSHTEGFWQWDLSNIQSQKITDNVVDLMTSRVQQVAPETQHMLKLAACLGSRFDLATLAVVAERTSSATAHALQQALEDNLIVPMSDDYRLVMFDVPGLSDQVTAEYAFAHDRVQQAAYALIPEQERHATHWQIGNVLLNRHKDNTHTHYNTLNSMSSASAVSLDHVSDMFTEVVAEELFDLVTHLNEGWSCCPTQGARDHLAALNALAGKRAKASAAYDSARRYLNMGLDSLTVPSETSCWQRAYNLARVLYVEAAEVAYLTGDFAETEELSKQVLEHATSLIDKVRVYEIQIMSCMAQNQHRDAIRTALDVLALLNVSLPDQPDPSDFVQGMQEVAEALGDRTIERIIDLPMMTDQYMLAALRILASVTSAAYLTDPQLAGLITLKQIALSLQYGNTAVSPFAYGMYGLILCGVLGDIDTGYRFGTLALKLAEYPAMREFKASTIHVATAGVRHWKEHIRDTLPSFLYAYQSGLEIGDVQYAASATYMHMVNSFIVGTNLVVLAQEKQAFSNVLAQLKQEAALMYHEIYRQVIANLLSNTPDPCCLCGDIYDEHVMVPKHQEAQDYAALHLVYSHKLILNYLFERYAAAVSYAEQAEATLAGVTASPQVPLFYFYDSLARLARVAENRGHNGTAEQEVNGANTVGAEEQAKTSANATNEETPEETSTSPDAVNAAHLEKVAANQQKLQQWAQHAPMNLLHKWYLVEAEHARVEGRDGDAWEAYYRALSLVQEHRFLNEEALTYELLARFYAQRKQNDIASIYLRRAYYAYQSWGAHAKVQALAERHAYLLETSDLYTSDEARTTVQIHEARGSTEQIDGRVTRTLDFSSVVKASQAISGEIVLETLLSKLMLVMLENAGAERGILLLDRGGEWVIEAESDIHSNETRVLQSIPVSTAEVPHTIINYVTNMRESIVLADAAHHDQFAHDNYIATYQPRSILCTPLINQGKLTGILYLENNQTVGVFTANRLEVLNLLYGQVAISIENARLYADTQSSEKKYRTLFEDSKDAIFMTTRDGKILNINPAGLSLFGLTQEEAVLTSIQNHYVSPIAHDDILNELTEHGSLRDFEITVRKYNGLEIDCVLTATWSQADNGTEANIHGILRDVTAQKRAEREQLQLTAIQREMSIARDIQHSLLPAPSPEWPDLDVRCYTKPAREIGGDLYSYLVIDTLDDQAELSPTSLVPRYAVVVGDVSGKGMPAALLMAVCVASLRSLAGQGLAPGEFLTRMDRAIAAHTRTTRQNCALVYVEIERIELNDNHSVPCNEATDASISGTSADEVAVWRLRIANAGCVAPLLKRQDGTVMWVDVGGLPLGVMIESKLCYQEVCLPMVPGDMVVLTSDGVIEAMNSNGEMFGFERLEQAVCSGPHENAAMMLEYLQHAVDAFVGATEPHDDITIVVVQV